MPVSIYPPTLASSQPAFWYGESNYQIYFTLQKVTQFSEIGHVQVRIVKQSNNSSIVNLEKYPDGTIYKPAPQKATLDNKYYVSISSSDLFQTWQPGTLYKIQMRFGTTPMFTSVYEFANWKQQQIDNQTFSEWSTVMIIKAITKPKIVIENAEAVVSTGITSVGRTELTLAPLFFGNCTIPESDKELVEEYKFDLYSGKKTLEEFQIEPKENLVESSDWLEHNGRDGSMDKHRFKTYLTNDKEYTVIYTIRTVNGYINSAKPYTFIAAQTYLPGGLEGVKLYVEDDSEYCLENGCINIQLSSQEPLTGAFVLTRTSQKSNYTVWEELKYFIFANKKLYGKETIHSDFTVESGVRYKYAFQKENSAGLRCQPLFDATNASHYVDFEYSYLYHDNIQLRLMFNQKMSSFKHTTLTSKQDTLGDRYPHLTRNGYAYYAEFPVTGLISFQMDPDRTFLKLEDSGFILDGETKIPRDKFVKQSFDRHPCSEDGNTEGLPGQFDNYNDLTIDCNLTQDNIFVERKFREEVEKFLNNFDYKLYKSPTEGNIVVVLQNVTMQPNAALGRMIYEFSATAYEVAENSLESLDKNGIINIGQFGYISTDDIVTTFGQVAGVFTSDKEPTVDVYAKIRKQEEKGIGGGYRLSLRNVKSFWIEYYQPEESILTKKYDEQGILVGAHPHFMPTGTAELIRLEAEKAQILNGEKEGDLEEIQKQIEYYKGVEGGDGKDGLSSRMPKTDDMVVPPVITKIRVDNSEILVTPNKVYALEQDIKALEVTSAQYPIIINYICELTQVEDLTLGVITGIDTAKIWGQISGIFTDTDSIIRNGYKYDYGPGIPPQRVYSDSGGEAGVKRDEFGDVLLDATNMNLYKTLNLYQAIEEETRRQVEKIYKDYVKDHFYKDKEGNWTSGTLGYYFSGIISIDVEAPEGTTLMVGKEPDGSDAVPIKINRTGRYILSPMDNLIRYIALRSPTFAIINYKCLTTQTIIKIVEGVETSNVRILR